METSTQAIGDVVVMTVNGRVDSATAPNLRAALNALLEEGKTRVVLDLTGVGYMSSAGFKAMIATLKTVRAANGDLCLCNVSDHIAELLRLGGLTMVFNIYANQAQAVESLRIAQ